MQINNIMLAVDVHQLVRSLSTTFFHSLWLGLLTAVMAAVVIACTTKSHPVIRYNLLLSLCGLFTVSVIATFFLIHYQHSSLSAVATAGTSEELNMRAETVTDQPANLSETTNWQMIIGFVNANSGIIAFMWLLVFLWKTSKLLIGLYGVQRTRLKGTVATAPEWQVTVNELALQLGIRKIVSILESAIVKVPCTVGHLKPVILVPIGMFAMLPVAQVESVLLHELAHVKRKDFAVNILLECIEAVFFFNPALLWLLHTVKQEREVCCDAMVATTEGAAKHYMEALVVFQERLVQPVFTMQLTGRSHLFYRVTRMISKKNKSLTTAEKFFLSLSIVIAVSLALLPKTSAKIIEKMKSAVVLSSERVELDNKQQASKPAHEKTRSSAKKPQRNILQAPAKTTMLSLEPQPVAKDTITSVRRYSNATPEQRIDYLEITLTSGVIYKIGKVEGTIVSFAVDGIEKTPADADGFLSLIDEAEERANADERAKRKQLQKQQTLVYGKRIAFHQTMEISKSTSSVSQTNSFFQKTQFEHKLVKTEEAKVQLLNASYHIKKKMQELENEKQQRRLGTPPIPKAPKNVRRPHVPLHDSVANVQRQRTKLILNLIVETGVVKDISSIKWFSLTEASFLVNGERLDAAMHQHLVKSCDISGKMGLHYGKVPGGAMGYFFGPRDVQ